MIDRIDSQSNGRARIGWRGAGLAALIAMLFALALAAAPSLSLAAAAKQTTFTTAEAAMEAFAAALKAHDLATLERILGPGAKDILESGDPIEDKAARERFTAAYESSHKLSLVLPTNATIMVGADDWPFPVPLVKDASAWRFDVREGKEELLNRRIGRNELWTQQAVLAYVDAQREYYARNPQNGKVLEYAQKFVSSDGKRDGLYFPTAAGEKPSPLGPLFDAQRAAGYVQNSGGKPGAYHGYYYRILKGQGRNAKAGAYDYVVKDRMIGGYALVAYPEAYGSSGIMTFIVNYEGLVYEKDLGADTAQIAQKMMHYDPDATWTQSKSGGL
ncbi:MAG: DUF2950 domain-containing protein [Burkholderiales bacterium]